MIVPFADSPFAGMMLELIDDGQSHPKSDLSRRARKPKPETPVRGRRRLVALVAAAGLVLIAAMSVLARLG